MVELSRWLFHLLAQKMKGGETFTPRLIFVDFNVITIRTGRPDSVNSSRNQPFLSANSFEERFRVLKQFSCLLADGGVIENGWVTSPQFPGMEKRRPINIWNQVPQSNRFLTAILILAGIDQICCVKDGSE